MEYYQELMNRVECVVEERIDVNMTVRFSSNGADVSLYCSEYDFEFEKRIYYRDMEIDSNPVLYIGNMLVRDFEEGLVRNIERK